MRRSLFAAMVILLLAGTASASGWQVTRLDNGLKVMILENHQVPQVNLSTTVQVGAKNETDYFDGATHLLEHLILFRGTETMTGDEVSQAMRKHGAYFNGFTSSDWTNFVISLPKEYIDYALQIHRDMLFYSNFPAAEMDKERQAIAEEINISEDEPFNKGYRESVKILYGSHPYGKNVLGTKEKIALIPRDSVYAYYKRYYAPNNMTLVIVGDIDAAATLELVKKYFGEVSPGTAPQDNYVPPPTREKVVGLEIKKDIGQAYLLMSTVGPKADSPDQFPLDIVASLIGDGQSSRLWKKLKTELGLVYSVGFSFSTAKYEGDITANATLDPANLTRAEQAINDVLNEIKQNGFTEDELRKAKNTIKTTHYMSMERGSDLANRYARYDSFIGYQFLDSYPANIEKVTLAEVNAAARKYLNTDTYVKTTVVPK
ncbi:MAG: insulinase family protein [candidate division Zixibacteria bacterium]|nr:insulinase family protein [candidate division Zixibacteria bacterium]